MDRAQAYQKRLDELGWTRSDLVKAIVELRSQRGESCTFQRIQTSIYKAVQQPEKTAASINDDIVTALGGKTILQWSQQIHIQ